MDIGNDFSGDKDVLEGENEALRVSHHPARIVTTFGKHILLHFLLFLRGFIRSKVGICPGECKVSSEEGIRASPGSKRGKKILHPWGVYHTG